jgi:ABC-2 type transport system ATP-binding protein
MQAAIRTAGLTKDYPVGFWRPRPYRALDDLTFEVGQGELFGFLGPNGAGKTTTLKLLMQLVFPTAGGAEILGRPVGDLAVRRRIGYLPENPYFYDHLTAEELLAYFAGLFGYRGADRRTRVSRLLDEVGIRGERRLQLRKFSKGMIQRVGIAQALVNDPEVVFLDEPMSGLDPLGRREVRQLMLRLRNEGRTIFFSSHILADAEALCTRVAIVAGGRLRTIGPVDEIVEFGVRGWEMIVANFSPALRQSLGADARRTTQISDGRYAIELGPDAPLDRVVASVVAGGGTLVSLNPVRETLEDVFVRHVEAAAPSAGRAMPSRAGGVR